MEEKPLMTKQRLASYVSLRLETENQLERLERLKNQEQIPAMKESDGSQHTGSGQRMERAIVRRIEYEERIAPTIKAAQEEMKAIEAAIAALPDPMEREVLRLRYVDGDFCRHMPWREVALKLFGNDDERYILATYRLHGRALVSISKVEETH